MVQCKGSSTLGLVARSGPGYHLIRNQRLHRVNNFKQQYDFLMWCCFFIFWTCFSLHFFHNSFLNRTAMSTIGLYIARIWPRQSYRRAIFASKPKKVGDPWFSGMGTLRVKHHSNVLNQLSLKQLARTEALDYKKKIFIVGSYCLDFHFTILIAP